MAPPLAGARKLSSTSTMKGTLSKTSLSFVYRPANAHRQGNSLEMRGNTKRDLIEKTDENGNTIYVVDREVIERSRIRIDARKWFLGKLFPKQFGDRVTHDGAVNLSLEKMFAEIDGQGDRIPTQGGTGASTSELSRIEELRGVFYVP